MKERGDREGAGGLMAQAKHWLQVLGMERYWGEVELPKKQRWKEIVGEAVGEWDKKRWRKWRGQKILMGEGLVASKKTWGPAPYLKWAGKRDRQLIAAIRLLSTRAGSDEGIGEGCRFCQKEHKETTKHLILWCPKWGGERARVIGSRHSTEEKKWELIVNGSPIGVAFLRTVSKDFRETTGACLTPWVPIMGERGVGGLEMVVVQMAKWLGTQGRG